MKASVVPTWYYGMMPPKRLEVEWERCWTLACSALLPVWPARAVLLPLNTSGSASLLLTEAGTSTQSLNHFLANTVKPH